MTKRITITAPERETFTVDLVGQEYVVTPPKAALAMGLSQEFQAKTEDGAPDNARMLSGLQKWVTAAFGKKQAKGVLARLSDPDDLLDYEQITELVSALYEQETDNPPT